MSNYKRKAFDEQKFWNQFKDFTPDECWPARSGIMKTGYSQTWVYPKMIYSHRLAWELIHGKIQKGLEICHKCDNPPCCNPNHLFLGTHLDNMRDSKEKGRNSHGPVLYGETHPLSKLTYKDVEEIRKIYVPTPRKKSEFNCYSLAKRYGVAPSLIHRIIKGISWPIASPEYDRKEII